MKNNNAAAIRKLSNRSLKNNRMRNGFVILAIILTGMLFTAVFSLVSGMIQVAQEETMREVGGRFHAGLKAATTEQYETIIRDPLVKKSSYTVYLGYAENIVKRQAELRYTPAATNLEDMFIRLEEGNMPTEENEIVVDTFILDELKLPHETGVTVPLTFTFMGETIEERFTVSGWYQGDYISHASELFLSEEYWTQLKGGFTDEDFKAWGREHPEDEGVGLMAVNVFFEDARDLEEKIRTVIQNAGYEPGTEVRYGVNWAYMSSRIESIDPVNYVFMAGAVSVILLTGYLIIYNIFQISVLTDIRFYGLLKTIGTTRKQIRRLVRRQAILLSAMGIPVGLLLGYGIGKALLPFALSFTDYGNMDISLSFSPWIFIFGAGFSLITVFLSCRKPGKIAGSVSAVEAVKYTESSVGKKKNRRRRSRFSILSMGLAGLGRNKGKTAVVVAAISLSMILLTLVMTGVGSFRLDDFLEQRIAGDFLLGNVNVTGTSPRSGDLEIDGDYLALADAQEGIEGRAELWVSYGKNIRIDERALQQYRSLDEEGKLSRQPHTLNELEAMLKGEGYIDSYVYGYSEELLENLEVLEGTLDMEKFQEGGYILLGTLLGNGHLPVEDHVYHPGDKITVCSITEDSTVHEITDEGGGVVNVWYDNLEEKQYEVMAIVDIPTSMDIHRYTSNACDAVLPLNELAGDGYSERFAVSYRIADEQQDAFEAVVKDYTEKINVQMGYLSKESLQREFDGMIRVVSVIGISLTAVIALIGILNFVNAMITGIIARKRELAMLQSIGMSRKQLQNMLICEGVGYVGIAGVISFVLGSLLAWKILAVLNNVILFFQYRFQILPFLIMIPVLLIVAVCTPLAAYKKLQKKSIVERLRETE